MGLTISKADAGPSAATAPPPMPSFADLSKAAADAIKEKEKQEKPNYLDLPAPLRYEDLQRETLMALKPDVFEGLRFEMTRPLNQNFFLSHSLFLGNMELGAGGRQVLKAPIGTYGGFGMGLHAPMLPACQTTTPRRTYSKGPWRVNSMQACKRWGAISGAIRWLLAGRWICLMLLHRAYSTQHDLSHTVCLCFACHARLLQSLVPTSSVKSTWCWVALQLMVRAWRRHGRAPCITSCC